MAIFNTGYDTTIGTAIVTKTIEMAIQKALIQDLIFQSSLDLSRNLEIKPVFVTGLYHSESSIPFFNHPLLVKNSKGIVFLCTDVRPYINPNTSTEGNLVARNYSEFNFVKTKAELNLAWLTEGQSQVKNNLGFAGVVFANWLSDVISKRFALDPRDQMLLAIVSHYYYQSLFYTEDRFDEDVLHKFAVHTINATKANSAMVFEVFDKIGKMQNIADLCENIKAVLGNVRLQDLNVGLLITIVGMSWYGVNASENLAVALEHPPTWNAIVYSAVQDRSYKNSNIARVAERFSRGGVANDYIRNVKSLLETVTVVTESREPTLDDLLKN